MKKTILVTAILLVTLTGFGAYKINTLNKEINELKTQQIELTGKLDKQLELTDELKRSVEDKESKLVETQKSLDEKVKENSQLKTDNETLVKEKEANQTTNNESTQNQVQSEPVYNESNVETYNDPVAERDAFAEQFEIEHGRPPSSGEVQMYWLEKQGLVE